LNGIPLAKTVMAIVTQKQKAMKKSMITMCFAAIFALCIPAAASTPDNAPPAKQEIRVMKKADPVKNENSETPKEVAPVTSENGNESSSAGAAHSGYIVISGAGLLLLIILLIILL
jgi:hypothetical protein